MGNMVMQLGEALYLKPGCRFSSQWSHWNFLLT